MAQLNTHRPKRPRDPAQLAKLIVDIATGEVEDSGSAPVNEAQQRGGLAGGKARAVSMSPKRRSEIAKKAANASRLLKKGPVCGAAGRGRGF